MGKVVVCKNTNVQKFANVELDEGKKLLISIANSGKNAGLSIMPLKLAGLIPGKSVFFCSLEDTAGICATHASDRGVDSDFDAPRLLADLAAEHENMAAFVRTLEKLQQRTSS